MTMRSKWLVWAGCSGTLEVPLERFGRRASELRAARRGPEYKRRARHRRCPNDTTPARAGVVPIEYGRWEPDQTRSLHTQRRAIQEPPTCGREFSCSLYELRAAREER